jgi:hypothetical protein
VEHVDVFFCFSNFPPNKIEIWIDDGVTALCPNCGLDAVLSSSVSPVTPAFLHQMHDRWFKESKKFQATAWNELVDATDAQAAGSPAAKPAEFASSVPLARFR